MEVEPPVMYERCVQVYNTMLDHAVVDDDDQAVYHGSFLKLINEAYGWTKYDGIRRLLIKMGCIRYIGPENANQFNTKWLLLQPPSEELFVQTKGTKRAYARLSSDGMRIVALEQRVKALEELVQRFELERTLLDGRKPA